MLSVSELSQFDGPHWIVWVFPAAMVVKWILPTMTRSLIQMVALFSFNKGRRNRAMKLLQVDQPDGPNEPTSGRPRGVGASTGRQASAEVDQD